MSLETGFEEEGPAITYLQVGERKIAMPIVPITKESLMGLQGQSSDKTRYLIFERFPEGGDVKLVYKSLYT